MSGTKVKLESVESFLERGGAILVLKPKGQPRRKGGSRG